jgi:transforming growth factor-beta-induced protein
MRRLTVLAVSAALALGVFAAPAMARPAAPSPSIADIVIANPDVTGDGTGDFSILLAAVQNADPAVLAALSSRGQYTVFAPTDAAFVALLAELGLTAQQVLGDRDLLTSVLLYHVAAGERDSGDVLGSSQIRMLSGGFLGQSGGVLTDNNGRTANIIAVDVQASNGIVHVIDRVVLP